MEFQFNDFDEHEADMWDDDFRDDDYDAPDEGPQFMAEMGAYERVGVPRMEEGPMLGEIEGIGKNELKDAHKKIMRMDLSGTEKLKLLLDDYSNKYRDKDFWPITDNEMGIIYKYISKLHEPGYKNPIGYMLGYYIVDRRGHIDKTRFDNIIKTVLPKIQNDISIKAEDVIRYARLWSNLL